MYIFTAYFIYRSYTMAISSIWYFFYSLCQKIEILIDILTLWISLLEIISRLL